MTERVRVKPPSPTTKKGTVGYKHPPKEHQFKPNTSGNPGGRPRKRRGMKEDLVEALDELVTVRGKKITGQRAWINWIVAGARRNMRASAQLSSWCKELLAAELEMELEAKTDDKPYDPGGRVKELLLEGLAGVAERLTATEHLRQKGMKEDPSTAKKEGDENTKKEDDENN